MEQSAEQVQRDMLTSWQSVLNRSDTFSRSLSPERVWLTAFHEFVSEATPAAANVDGTVASGQFYALLNEFLAAQV
jgi:hypothetical protein